jgi:DNA-binding transcriptional ArsR family regulator
MDQACEMAWSSGRNEWITARELMTRRFDPINWIVQSYIVEGLTVFAGAPKMGKSWLMLGVAAAVAGGGTALGSIPCEAGDVLYLALEDNHRRLQSRLLHMQLQNPPDRLTFATRWASLDDGCVDQLEGWLAGCAKPRLIVIDVFAKVRGVNAGRETQYEADYRFAAALQELAGRRAIGIVVVHHTRKMDAEDPFDAVSGTRGLTGAADSVLVLQREPGSTTPVLYGRGRDMEEVSTALEFVRDTGTWVICGDAADRAKTAERQAILYLLARNAEPMTPTEIAMELGKDRSNVSHLLKRLSDEGKVTKESKGRYTPVTPFTPFTQVE